MRIVRCERCGWIGRETEITIPDHCPDCGEYGGLKLCDGEQEYSIDELRFLWEQFDDIPINDADEIDEEYMGWPVGTSRFDIWHWFDARWPKGVYNLVYEEGGFIMMTRQEMDALVGRTLIIREFPHICLAAGDDALLLLQIAVKDESFLKKGDPIKYIVAHYPEFQGDKLVWGQGEYYDIWAYREKDGIPATAQALRDASLTLAGRKVSVAMLNDGNGTKCAGVFTTETRAETWLEKSLQADADAHTWVETKHVNRPEKDF